jgi:predicted TIM-barrel fold metal-dependent hydrolase
MRTPGYRFSMPVIDCDTHFETVISRDEHPFADWLGTLPSSKEMMGDALAGELARCTPPEDLPPTDQIVAFMPRENYSSLQHVLYEADDPEFVVSSATERLQWMDEVGIDYALINPGGYFLLADYVDDRASAFRRCNDFLANRLAGHTDRLFPVTLLDYSDLQAAAAELRRMRALGSRAFWVQAAPINGMSPAHPDWDVLWGTATELGMIGLLHIGNTPNNFDGWGNAGWMRPGGGGLFGYFSYANALHHQAAEMLLAAMIHGGVFDRHPNLTIITEELLVAWLPGFVSRCDAFGRGDIVRRNIRATPLVGLGDTDPLETVLPVLPEMLVFSSDYPHGEGHASPITRLEPALSDLDDARRSFFLGDNLAECYARMGDPLSR